MQPMTASRPSTFLAWCSAFWRLARFDRPVGIWLLWWPTAWALWLSAGGLPDWPRLLVFLAGTVLMRAAGCVLNDLADRRFDGHVQRTQARPLATGELRPREGVLAALVLLLGAAALLPALSAQALVWAWLAVAITAAYPFFKRFFPAPQAVLGLAFSCGIPMVYADTRGGVPIEAWLLVLGSLLWTIAYDTAYAMVDREDDLRLGLRSSAIWLGRWDVIGFGLLQAGFLALIAAVGVLQVLGPAFWLLGWLPAVLLAGFLTHRLRSRRREQCLAVFRQSHWVGGLLWLGMALSLQL